MRPDAVVFDMDGVLIDSEPVHYESTVRLFSDQLGMTLKESVNNEFLGSTDRHMFEVLKERYNLEPSVEELVSRRKAIYMAIVEKDGLPWRPGIRELIAALATSGYRLAVASSGLRRIVEHTLTEGNISHHFETVVTGDDIRNPKPAPDIYLKAAQQLDLPPEQCVAIEDSNFGVRAAHAAGMHVIASPCSSTVGMDFSSADLILESAREIQEFLCT